MVKSNKVGYFTIESKELSRNSLRYSVVYTGVIGFGLLFPHHLLIKEDFHVFNFVLHSKSMMIHQQKSY